MTQKRLQLWEEDGADANQQYTSWLDVMYGYNQFGQVNSITYPTNYLTYLGNSAPPQLTTGFDSMQRPNSLTLGSTQTVSGVTYNASNQPLTTSFSSGSQSYTESRVYNALNQLVTLTGGNVNISYIYSNTANNGQITNMTDNVLGQTTNYTYDALKRLSHADFYIGSSLHGAGADDE